MFAGKVEKHVHERRSLEADRKSHLFKLYARLRVGSLTVTWEECLVRWIRLDVDVDGMCVSSARSACELGEL